MTDQSPSGNSFRRSVIAGEKRKLVVTDKNPKLARQDPASDALDDVKVPRSEARRGDHRDLSRHRLIGETGQFEYRMVMRTLKTDDVRRLSETLNADRAVTEYRISPASD